MHSRGRNLCCPRGPKIHIIIISNIEEGKMHAEFYPKKGCCKFRNLKNAISPCILYKGSYMSAHVLLNLLNELGKRYKMQGLPSILSLFRNEFNKFN